MAIIGVDVDLTVVRSDYGWFDWCNKLSAHKHYAQDFIDSGKLIPYNFCSLYPDLEVSQVLDYWRQRDIYDNLSPISGSVEALSYLSKRHEIVFVSTIKGDHHKSKYQFVDRNYPFMDGFIATKEKKYARVDVMIDDRLDVLHKVDRVGIIPIHFQSPHEQDSIFTPKYTAKDWWSIEEVIYNALRSKIKPVVRSINDHPTCD